MLRADRRSIALLSVLVVAISLPFIGRAYFVDDYYFVSMAKGILEQPLRPYDFRSDDEGHANRAWEPGQLPRMVNPPLFHYYLAGVIKVAGEQPWKLRLSTVLFSLLSVWSMYFLGKRFVGAPVRPAALMAVTPVFWLTSYSLLIDSMLLAFLLMTLLTFVIAHEKRSAGWVVLSGTLMGLTMLVKYFGAIAVPLVLAWQILDPARRRWKTGYLALVLFFLIQTGWALWNVSTYGTSHLWATLPRGVHSNPYFYLDKLLVLASFMGGGFVFVLASWIPLGRLNPKRAAGLFILMACLCWILQSPSGGYSFGQSLTMSLFASGTLAYLLVIVPIPFRRPEPACLFLLLWLVLGLLELIVVMPWTAARYFLCVLPAASWLFSIALEELSLKRLWNFSVVATALMGGIVALADSSQANTLQSLVRSLSTISVPKTGTRYYLGDTFSGYQPYLEPLGWKAAFPNQEFKSGDLLLVARYRRSSWWNLPKHLRMHSIAQYAYPSLNPVRVMDVPASAGWYASVWGSLPYSFTSDPLERYDLLRVD